MRTLLIVLWTLLCSITSAAAQVSVGIGFPGVSIGINLPVYPELVPVPGYPVYYAPRVNSNYFFYDGMYWVYQGDNWYASTWYNGPWELVPPEAVPLYVLRIPVRYYRRPPAYFRGWSSEAPPRWGQHWGNAWEQRRSGWDNWNRSAVPAPAPLPIYQRQYSGNRYPRGEQQQALQARNYRYQPQDNVVQQHYQARQLPQGTPQRQAQQPPQGAAQRQAQQPPQGPPQRQAQPPQHPQPPHGAAQREQQAPREQGQNKGPQGHAPTREPKQDQAKGHEKGEEKGGEHKK